MTKFATDYIKNATYYPIRMLLEIQFIGDESIYQYFDVPEEVWYGMKNAYPMDIYFNTQIASQFKNKCVQRRRNGR